MKKNLFNENEMEQAKGFFLPKGKKLTSYNKKGNFYFLEDASGWVIDDYCGAFMTQKEAIEKAIDICEVEWRSSHPHHYISYYVRRCNRANFNPYNEEDMGWYGDFICQVDHNGIIKND